MLNSQLTFFTGSSLCTLVLVTVYLWFRTIARFQNNCRLIEFNLILHSHSLSQALFSRFKCSLSLSFQRLNQFDSPEIENDYQERKIWVCEFTKLNFSWRWFSHGLKKIGVIFPSQNFIISMDEGISTPRSKFHSLNGWEFYLCFLSLSLFSAIFFTIWYGDIDTWDCTPILKWKQSLMNNFSMKKSTTHFFLHHTFEDIFSVI